MANRAVGLARTPPDMLWHHVEDAETMLLIPKEIQRRGEAYWRERSHLAWKVK
jgi:hypothetical protein